MSPFNKIKKFGYCTLASNEFLFRKYKDHKYHESMFFSFRPNDSFSHTTNSRETQKWKTTRRLRLILFIHSVDKRGWVKSNINEAFSILNPQININSFDELTIKKDRKDLRQKFVTQLTNFGFDGWVTSIEEKYEMELFLFSNNRNAVSYLKKKEYVMSISTLHRLKFFLPTNISKCIKKINKEHPINTFQNTNWKNKYIREKQNEITVRQLIK